MEFPNPISRMSPFPIIGVSGENFPFFSFNGIFCKQTASDLGLHWLPMSHKKDARLILVNIWT